jgi:uncharacterized membrane protein YjjP (DUF1212 family)
MKTILALLLSAIVGFLIGLRHRVVVIAFVAPIIAVAAAIIVRHSHFVLAVVIVFASLLVSQIAYLIGAWLRYRSTTKKV